MDRHLDVPDLTWNEAKAIVDGKPLPKVTEADILAKIDRVVYVVVTGGGMLCLIYMKNGWISTGFTAPASPGNYDPQVAKRYSYDHAFKPLWQLEGYLLKERLYQAQQPDQLPDPA